MFWLLGKKEKWKSEKKRNVHNERICTRPYSSDNTIIPLVGLEKQIDEAVGTINLCKKQNRPAFIAIWGDTKSGKTTLAKTILQKFGSYSVIDLTEVSYDRFFMFLLRNKTVVLEGIDRVMDYRVIDRLNYIFTTDKKGIRLNNGDLLKYNQLTIILTFDKSNMENIIKRYNLSKIAHVFINYGRLDYARIYLYCCEVAGLKPSDNSIIIDNRALAYAATLLRNNIKAFQIFVFRLFDYSIGKDKVVVDMKNITVLLSELVDYSQILGN